MRSLPADLLSRTAEESTRMIALAQLDDASAAAARIEDPTDKAALHDFRVAIRRLRSTARAHREHVGLAIGKKRARSLRTVQRATGGARDAEVALRWLRRARKGASAELKMGADLVAASFDTRDQAMSARTLAKASARFTQFSPALRRKIEVAEVSMTKGLRGTSFGVVLAGLARAHVAELAAQLCEIEHAEDESAIHDARIAGKRLRYLLEPARHSHADTSAVLKRLKRLQDALGELHDVQWLSGRVNERLAKARPRGQQETPELAALCALSDHIEHERLSLFAGVQQDHLGEVISELVAEVDRLAARYEQAGDEETERKFLLRGKPRMRGAKKKRIEQGWLPGDRLRERLRRVTQDGAETFLRTIKLGAGVKRVEVEEELPRDLFEALWPLTEGCRVFKTRYTLRDRGLVWEIDEFEDRELFLAEVELPSARIRPPIPKWLARQLVSDVTGESTYVNLLLAR